MPDERQRPLKDYHRVPPRLAAALKEYRTRYCRPDCLRCSMGLEGIEACSRDAAWAALARIRRRLKATAGGL